jgi:hypothetical protein
MADCWMTEQPTQPQEKQPEMVKVTQPRIPQQQKRGKGFKEQYPKRNYHNMQKYRIGTPHNV